jgi:hypothetical protein
MAPEYFYYKNSCDTHRVSHENNEKKKDEIFQKVKMHVRVNDFNFPKRFVTCGGQIPLDNVPHEIR